MALYKEIRQDDGVTTNYHRVLFVQQMVNHHNSIAVLSYVDDEARENEKEFVIAQPYMRSVTYEMAYDPTMTVETAYDYLKTLPQFEGAIDI